MPGALAQPSANVPCVNRDQLNHEKKKKRRAKETKELGQSDKSPQRLLQVGW